MSFCAPPRAKSRRCHYTRKPRPPQCFARSGTQSHPPPKNPRSTNAVVNIAAITRQPTDNADDIDGEMEPVHGVRPVQRTLHVDTNDHGIDDQDDYDEPVEAGRVHQVAGQYARRSLVPARVHYLHAILASLCRRYALPRLSTSDSYIHTML